VNGTKTDVEHGLHDQRTLARFDCIKCRSLSDVPEVNGNPIDADWFINYDEIFYMLEGNFRVIIEGEVFDGNAGDTIFLPKDTQLPYESTGKAKLFYIVHPDGNVRSRLLVGRD